MDTRFYSFLQFAMWVGVGIIGHYWELVGSIGKEHLSNVVPLHPEKINDNEKECIVGAGGSIALEFSHHFRLHPAFAGDRGRVG